MENTAAPTPTAAAHDRFDDDVARALRDDGSLSPSYDPHVDRDLVIALYREMTRVRAIDERLVSLQRQGRIGFHVGSYGEEAAILGAAASLRPQDWIFPAYREFGAALWRGMPLASYLNHMFGNAGDPIKGRQMPDHYGSRIAKFGSVSSPVGTQITQAAGFAWAAKIKRDDVATLVYFGEGATSSGEFHNGINFAGVFKAPLVLFCRNNSWSTSSESFAAKGIAYGVPGVRVDGNDLFAVLRVTRDAIARAIAGDGPTLIEALTSRLASSDPRDSRDGRDGGDAWRKRDPIARVRRHLEANGAWSDAKQEELDARIEAEIVAAIDDAERLGPPAIETMFDDVYGEIPRHLEAQKRELLSAPRPPQMPPQKKPSDKPE
jgi:2-oxoisovalerate dehydrogenase E1 component alpha subunit